MACISHVSDKVIFGDEASFGTEAVSFTKDMGQIQSFSVNEAENIDQIGQVGSSFNYSSNESGVYIVTGTLETYATKSSLPVLLEILMGSKSSDATDYTATNSLDIKSLSAKVEYTPTTILKLLGIVFTNVTYDVTKDGNFTISADYFAKVVSEETETIVANTNIETLFKGLDISATFGGTALVVNSLSLTADWNMTPEDGRGMESVLAGERRQIQRACKHNLVVSGNIEYDSLANFEFGYEDTKTNQDLIITINRDTDNVHVFTFTGCLLDNKELISNTEAGLRTVSADILSIDYSVTGDE